MKRKLLLIVISFLPIACAGNLPFARITETPIPPTSTFTPTSTLIPTITVTPIPEVNWTGNWTTWVEDTNEWSGQFVQFGDSVNATLIGTESAWIKIAGAISDGGETLSGTWEDSYGGMGVFTFQLNENMDQFVGNWDESGAWCGTRLDAAHPSPCYGP